MGRKGWEERDCDCEGRYVKNGDGDGEWRMEN